MGQPLSTEELMRLDAELAARTAPLPGVPHPAPHPSLPPTLGAGSNVAYVSKEENDRLVSAALALGMGQFAKMTADETHRFAARLSRR
ncbi:hypothetical protein [Brevundimonas nasdae]|uniref:Uncharacterized protein n=1 Tax=Brevundimonas nasdae TaxID=172043 RepID=A0ABX8TL97_9CAUL|nr:hypothetical protein [Brevundimonas nasdae]QYC10545.1 hypothetical protein KWG56_00535 [Brevundimonas nasdae]QYC13332.1 hypothetical protein KWG63_14090 [Brevundimonas nasdae]